MSELDKVLANMKRPKKPLIPPENVDAFAADLSAVMLKLIEAIQAQAAKDSAEMLVGIDQSKH